MLKSMPIHSTLLLINLGALNTIIKQPEVLFDQSIIVVDGTLQGRFQVVASDWLARGSGDSALFSFRKNGSAPFSFWLTVNRAKTAVTYVMQLITSVKPILPIASSTHRDAPARRRSTAGLSKERRP